MSTIQENLEKILHAVFGRDVRQAIHDGIKNCYDDGIAGSEELNDVRNGYDGTSYPTAGEAVRSQFNSLNSELSEEKTQRETADRNLQNAINTESNARSTADTTLQEKIDNEATERTNADNAIKESLASEKSARENADSTLQRNIESEASERETAYSTLQRNIENEKSARETADNAINASLESHGTRLNNLEHYTIKVDSEGYIAVEYKD